MSTRKRKQVSAKTKVETGKTVVKKEKKRTKKEQKKDAELSGLEKKTQLLEETERVETTKTETIKLTSECVFLVAMSPKKTKKKNNDLRYYRLDQCSHHGKKYFWFVPLIYTRWKKFNFWG